MNGMVLLGFMFILPACPPTRAMNETINMIRNPSFEFKTINNVYGNIPLYWERYKGSNIAVSITNKQGGYSLMLVDTGNDDVGVWTEKIPVIPGRVYTARAWGRKSANSMYPKLYTRYCDINDNIVSNANVNVGSVNSWDEGVITATAPTNADYVRILLYSGTTLSAGTGYFDCVSFTLSGEQVSDGSFSNATVGTLPVHWKVYTSYNGASQTSQTDPLTDDMALCLVDTLTTDDCGAYRYVPASPGVPYKLTASVRLLAGGAGNAKICQRFYDPTGALLTNVYTSTASDSYTTLTLTNTAPAGASYGMILCYMNDETKGTSYFDNISFTENYANFYAAPVQAGNGAGTNAATAACYTNIAWWSNTVNTAAAGSPVKATLLTGIYTNYCFIPNIGNPSNRILITGETPFSVDYGDDTTTPDNLFFHLTRSTNITLRHLHFTGNDDPVMLVAAITNKSVYAYKGVLLVSYSTNVTVEGLTFTDMRLLPAGAFSIYGISYDITVNHCSWVRVGLSTSDHCIYAVKYSYVTVKDCYFQDNIGCYVRYRSGSEGTVQNNTFISTGTVHPPVTNRHYSFVQMCGFNSATSKNEMLGKHFYIAGNSFTYETQSGYRAPFWIHMSGPAPTSHDGNPESEGIWHLVPTNIGLDYIANTNESVDVRNAYFQQYFGVNLKNDYVVTNNMYSGCWPRVKVMMSSTPDPSTNWTAGYSGIELDNCNLSALLGL